MTPEQKERTKEYKKHEVTFLAVAEILGGTLDTRPDEIWTFVRSIKLAKGEIFVRFGGNWGPKGSYHISGSYPRDAKQSYINPYDYNETRQDSINCSSNKTPEQIAKDIARRLLPEYFLRLAKVEKQILDNDTYHADRKTAIEFVSRETGLPIETDKEGGTIRVDYGEISGACEPIGHHDIHLELRYITPEQAAHIINYLKASTPEKVEARKSGTR